MNYVPLITQSARHCEQSEAIQYSGYAALSGSPRRFAARDDEKIEVLNYEL